MCFAVLGKEWYLRECCVANHAQVDVLDLEYIGKSIPSNQSDHRACKEIYWYRDASNSSGCIFLASPIQAEGAKEEWEAMEEVETLKWWNDGIFLMGKPLLDVR